MTPDRLSELRAVPIMELEREDLSDMDEIIMFPSESQKQRMRSFLEQVKNPFAQKAGAYILRIGYMEGAEDTFDERMLLFVKRKARIEG